MMTSRDGQYFTVSVHDDESSRDGQYFTVSVHDDES